MRTKVFGDSTDFACRQDRFMKAVQIDDYGGVEVLDVREVERPEPGSNQVLVAVRAAGINPSEGTMRAGRVREIFPADVSERPGFGPCRRGRGGRRVRARAWPWATR